ncbi:MAG: hypothetical protein CfP315_0337 [Candidatus Improbicoccus pseudotrichonymphae]|uniref:Uncharacterized protein n=1 Tax=Candidatus Improbicoccus pseudotrichonymphae TaxID=3033792 RepID=A0AA48HY18_9FIRM|nr:MAG: hypothetical protein CfP315_0337 [Candidatus Improbicoccus pseudotrichonymphae]
MKNNLKKFYERLASDSTLREKIMKINSETIKPGEKLTEEKKKQVMGKIIPLASKAIGEKLKIEDFEKFEKETKSNKEILDDISGGVLGICVGAGAGTSLVTGKNSENLIVEQGYGLIFCVYAGIGGGYMEGKENKEDYRKKEIETKSTCIILGF